MTLADDYLCGVEAMPEGVEAMPEGFEAMPEGFEPLARSFDQCRDAMLDGPVFDILDQAIEALEDEAGDRRSPQEARDLASVTAYQLREARDMVRDLTAPFAGRMVAREAADDAETLADERRHMRRAAEAAQSRKAAR